MTTRRDPLNPVDADARALATKLLGEARHAALAYSDAETGFPGISRIALGLDLDGRPVSLLSSLAPHVAALRTRPDCALLVGEPGPKGDPLTHPRLMLRATARFVDAKDPARAALRAHWLAGHPKSRLYVDFADFAFVRFAIGSALLNGGFGRAYALTRGDFGV